MNFIKNYISKDTNVLYYQTTTIIFALGFIIVSSILLDIYFKNNNIFKEIVFKNYMNVDIVNAYPDNDDMENDDMENDDMENDDMEHDYINEDTDNEEEDIKFEKDLDSESEYDD